MDQTEITTSPKLRAIFLVVSIIMFVFWGLSLIPPIRAWGDPNEDGFSYMPAFWATITCLPVGLYLLAGAITGRGRHVARARTALFLAALSCGGVPDSPAHRRTVDACRATDSAGYKKAGC